MTAPAPAGFTLLELLVVIAVLAVAATLVGPRLGSRGGDGMQLRSARTAVSAALAGAREAAIRDGRPRCLSIVAASPSRNCPPLRLEADVTANAQAPGRIRFFGDGSSTGGTITLAAGSARGTVSVVGATGQIAAR